MLNRLCFCSHSMTASGRSLPVVTDRFGSLLPVVTGRSRPKETIGDTILVLLSVIVSPPVYFGQRSEAAGSDNRSLNQPNRSSFTIVDEMIDVQAAFPYRVSTVELPLFAIMLPFVSTAWVWMPCGDFQCIALSCMLKVFRGVAFQSTFPNPITELTLRGTSTFIWRRMKPVAAAHCDAVAVQAAVILLPLRSVNWVLMMRFCPGKFRLTISPLRK